MSRRGGFTLLEVLVALALGAAVVLMVHRVFVGVVEATTRAEEAQAFLDRDANSRRRLASLVGSLEVGLTEADPFQGEPRGVSFTAWDRDANGWLMRRRVTVVHRDSRLLVYGLDARAICLVDSVQTLAIDYLLEPGVNARWVERWSSTATAPLAMRLRMSRPGGADTLLFAIGARG